MSGIYESGGDELLGDGREVEPVMPETERRKPAEEMKARAANLVETLLTSRLRGKWRAMDFASKVAVFAAKEIERAALLEAAGLVCTKCLRTEFFTPAKTDGDGVWYHMHIDSSATYATCESASIHERRAQKGNG